MATKNKTKSPRKTANKERGTEIARKLFLRPNGATMPEIKAASGDTQYNLKRRMEVKGFKFTTKQDGRLTRYMAKAPKGKGAHVAA